MGTAVSAFREKLGESLASIQRYDAKIEEATTPSLEALKAYSQGLRTRRTTGDFDSVPFFRRAIELDPEFALAYARLGTVYANLGQADEARKMTTQAYELREKVSEAERSTSRRATTRRCSPTCRRRSTSTSVWLATYPNDYTALTNSALLHKQQGDRAEAIRKLELATKVAPDQPLAFTNLGQTYFEAGQYAEARQALRDRDPAAGFDRRPRRPLSDRDPDGRHGARRCSKSPRSRAAATKWTWSASACSPRPIAAG